MAELCRLSESLSVFIELEMSGTALPGMGSVAWQEESPKLEPKPDVSLPFLLLRGTPPGSVRGTSSSATSGANSFSDREKNRRATSSTVCCNTFCNASALSLARQEVGLDGLGGLPSCGLSVPVSGFRTSPRLEEVRITGAGLGICRISLEGC